MRNLIILILSLAAQHLADGSSITRNTSHFIQEDLEEFRIRLDDLPNEFFDLEMTIHNLDIEGSNILLEEITNFRKELTEMSGEMQNKLFDIELTLNNLLQDKDDDKDDDSSSDCATWTLAMNLNPEDGHIMDYTTGWDSETSIGRDEEALYKDYKNQTTWEQPADYIAIVRHQHGTIDAVKVFKFIEGGVRSLSSRFDSRYANYNYRAVVTTGGPIQRTIARNATNMADDPVFAVAGDLVFNLGYGNDGERIALTGALNVSVNNYLYGLGGHYDCNPKTGVSTNFIYKHEIAVICPSTSPCYKVQGTDHGSASAFNNSVPAYGNYAIYISQNATTFPKPGHKLQLEIQQCL